MSSCLKHFFCLTFLAFLLAFNFFHVGKYNLYPWWHETGGDTDATYAAQTVALLNGGKLDFIHHPGAGIYFVHGLGYRLAGIFSPTHKELGHLDGIKNLDDASRILSTATRTSRILALVTAIVLAGVLYVFIFLMTRSAALAFAWTFYAVTTQVFAYHTHVVRPELPNLLFFLCAGIVLWRSFSASPMTLKRWIFSAAAAGFFLGCSLLTKIQILPALGVLALLLFAFWGKTYNRWSHPLTPGLWKALGLLIAFSAVALPWWAVARPEWLTPQTVAALHPEPDDRRVYGDAPETFVPVATSALAIVSLFALMGFLLNRRESFRPFASFLGRLLLFLLALVAGGIVSIYLLLLPVSVSVEHYRENTRHLVYATLTNLTGGGFVIHPKLDHETWPKIHGAHGEQTRFFELNLIDIICLVIGVCILRLVYPSKRNKDWYVFILFFFAAGFAMDVAATLRWSEYMSYYALYSLAFFTLGLAVWIAGECEAGRRRLGPSVFSSDLRLFLTLAFSFFIVQTSLRILTETPASGVSTDNPAKEYLNTKSHAPSFWNGVNARVQGIPQ